MLHIHTTWSYQKNSLLVRWAGYELLLVSTLHTDLKTVQAYRNYVWSVVCLRNGNIQLLWNISNTVLFVF